MKVKVVGVEETSEDTMAVCVSHEDGTLFLAMPIKHARRYYIGSEWELALKKPAQ